MVFPIIGSEASLMRKSHRKSRGHPRPNHHWGPTNVYTYVYIYIFMHGYISDIDSNILWFYDIIYIYIYIIPYGQ